MRYLILPVMMSLTVAPACTEDRQTASDIAHLSTPTKAVPEQREEAVGPLGSSYSIIGDQTVPGVKRSVDVRLAEKVPEDVLRSIAVQIRSADSSAYDRTFISYYLPGMEVGAGAWATSHFNPSLDIQILGLSAADEAMLATRASDSREGNIIGCWLDEFAGGRITLFEVDGRLFIERSFKDGSSLKTEVAEKPSALGRRFDPVEDGHGDYWVLDSRGHLQIRDGEGLIATAKEIADCD